MRPCQMSIFASAIATMPLFEFIHGVTPLTLLPQCLHCRSLPPSGGTSILLPSQSPGLGNILARAAFPILHLVEICWNHPCLLQDPYDH